MNEAHIKFKVLGKTFPVPDDLLQDLPFPQFRIEPQWLRNPLDWKLSVIGQPSGINLSLFMHHPLSNATDVGVPESFMQASS